VAGAGAVIEGRLSPLQRRVLRTLATLRPRWTLSGGGALVGFHTGHRETRDLDLFWQGARELVTATEDARSLLARQGLEVTSVQTQPAFARFQVRSDEEMTVVDLVADPVPLAETPHEQDIEGERILVDTPHQILVNKLCAMLGRAELRDLEDIQVLRDRGGDLRRALIDAPAQDAGFSPLTLAWVIRQLPIEKLARALGRDSEVRALEEQRDDLVERVLALATTGE
jgi:hypothetical protein